MESSCNDFEAEKREHMDLEDHVSSESKTGTHWAYFEIFWRWRAESRGDMALVDRVLEGPERVHMKLFSKTFGGEWVGCFRAEEIMSFFSLTYSTGR